VHYNTPLCTLTQHCARFQIIIVSDSTFNVISANGVIDKHCLYWTALLVSAYPLLTYIGLNNAS